MISQIPRPEYPRPDFERSDWLNLNGEWDFEYDADDRGEREKWFMGNDFSQKIIVPFCCQSELSGIGDRTPPDIVWYRRTFAIPAAFLRKRVFLNFGAVDFDTKVWINGTLAGTHRGGYSSFQFDITGLVKEDTPNTVVIRVEDQNTNSSQPRGKQTWKGKNFRCWYTPVTGIWQTVWLEALTDTHLKKVKMTPDVDSGSVRLDFDITGPVTDDMLHIVINCGASEIANVHLKVLQTIFSHTLDLKSNRLEEKFLTWSPEEPNLYDIRLELIRDGEEIDVVKSYFGMRKVATKNGAVLLNNQPIYQRLVLNQGYYNGGLLTAASDEEYRRDIRLIKEFGFNGVRLHQKVEDPRFLYWADKMGLLVWGEMASAFEFNDQMMADNMAEWQRAVERDYNHPCIIAWTLMNESWGIPNILVDIKQQHHTLSLYYMVKAYDDTRLVISNDGWEHTDSDLITFHDYTQDGAILAQRIACKDRILSEPICSIGNKLGAKYLFAEGYRYNGQPILLSECCGVAFDSGQGWGYGVSVHHQSEFLERYQSIISVVRDSDYIAGFCCTQLTDVEQEINGLMTIERIPKIDPAQFSRIILGSAGK